MATDYGNRIVSLSSNAFFRQTQLISLISVLSAPRDQLPDSDLRQLVVDSRLQWQGYPVDGQSSWLYLAQPAHARQFADCIVLTADD
jgi:hypothetical protein